MLWASSWQWQRYLWKEALVKTYQEDAVATATPLNAENLKIENFAEHFDRRVSLFGKYDFEHQFIVLNKRDRTGPGHHLFTPLCPLTPTLEVDSNLPCIIVSRGFIPFEDRTPETWRKYDFVNPIEKMSGVLKRSIQPMALGPSNPDPKEGYQSLWYYEQIDKIAEQIPYSIVKTAYIQRVGKSPVGQFPAEAISIEIPPSTHYWYTIEWIFLAIATCSVGYVMQRYPKIFKRRRSSLVGELE
jgi:cytochrome oxidase assembly protein ShyY1